MSGCGAEHGLLTVDDALACIQRQTKALPVENIDLGDSLHQYLSDAIYAEVNLPEFSQSAVDGYALSSINHPLKGLCFEVIGEVRAGSESKQKLAEHEAIRIFTGGKIPEGTTHIARQEIVTLLLDQRICLTENIAAQADIRFLAEEIQIGQCLAQAGQQLNVGTLAALSMLGVAQVKVFKSPKVAVLITGDEVAKRPADVQTGQIFDGNGPLLKAWFKCYGLEVEIIHVVDDAVQLSQHLAKFKMQYDVIISTGGVSVGDYDLVRASAFAVGFEQIFWKVKQKPGKPLFFAKYTDQHAQQCYLLGLPGNPAAVYVCMQIYGRALLDALQNHRQSLPWFSAVLTQDIKPDARERWLRMYAYFEQGQLKLRCLPKQQSHMLSNLISANCLVRIPADTIVLQHTLLNGLFIYY